MQHERDGFTSNEIRETQFIFSYFARCPDCGTHQAMTMQNIRWEGGSAADPVEVETSRLARYCCHACGSLWNDHQRNLAVQAGEWRGLPTREWPSRLDRLKKGEHVAMVDAVELFTLLRKEKPERIGFHTPAWISSFVSLSKSAAAFLRSQVSLEKLKDFQNNYAAEPWKAYRKEREEDRILALRDERPRGLVPAGGRISCLLGSADTQDDGFYYEIRAWGYGLSQESWCVREGFVVSLDDLAEIFFKTLYQDAAGNKYLVQYATIDAMGHRTKEVYEFCSMNKGRIWPLKGEQTMTQPYAFTKIEVYPGTNKPIPGGVMLLRINTNFYKDDLSSRLAIHPTDPGAYHLHADYTEAWARQMCAEFVNEKGVWECPASTPNHGWDVAVYNLALADVCQVKFIQPPEQQAKARAGGVISKGVEP